LATRDNAKVRETIWGYAKGVDGINTFVRRLNSMRRHPRGERLLE